MVTKKNQGAHRKRFMQALFLLALFTVVGVAACSAAELEPLFSDTIPVTRESEPTQELPGLMSAPGATPTPVQGESETATITTGTPATGPPPSHQAVPAGVEGIRETPGTNSEISPTPTPWDVPSRWPTPTPVPPPPGLLYENETGLWLVANDWQPEPLAQIGRRPILSPDASKALTHEGDDLWLIDLSSNERLNLTEETGRVHCCAQWWPARPGMIIFGSWTGTTDLGPTTGYLSAYDVNDGNYRVLDEQAPSNAAPSPGPDGQRIAYDRTGSAWMYHWGENPKPFNPADFGLENISRIGGPSWSPDGRKLAWTVAAHDSESGQRRIALAIFDLEAGTGQLMHLYDNLGRGGWFDPPVWSPDGRWLAFVAEDINIDRYGLWVAATDGSREHFLGPGSNPIWSPDNHWLSYTAYSAELDPAEEVRLAEVESWYSIKMNLPLGSTIHGWLEQEPGTR